MKVYFLSGSTNNSKKRLQRVLDFMLPQECILDIRTITDLEMKLRRESLGEIIALILRVNKRNLSQLIAMKELFKDTDVILILDKRDSEIIASSHLLRPRFVTYADSDFLDVASVLIKMKERNTARLQGPT